MLTGRNRLPVQQQLMIITRFADKPTDTTYRISAVLLVLEYNVANSVETKDLHEKTPITRTIPYMLRLKTHALHSTDV